MRTIELAVNRPYQIHIGSGLLNDIAHLTGEVYESGKLALIMDENIAQLYGEKVATAYKKAGYDVCTYAFPAGEAAKNMQQLTLLLEFLAGQNFSRHNLLVALGGGVTGDLAGFAAAVYQRGMPYIQVPTSLLAAVDSSLGGKTAVNLTAGKNLAGAFHQPALVICDCDVLTTLPKAELISGLAECIKYAVLADEQLLAMFTEKGLDVDWQQIIPRCVMHKAAIVCQDEKEQGRRQLLNLGHTFGHAIEHLSGYTLRHGEAIGIGMLLISRAAEEMQICEAGTAAAIAAALKACDLPLSCSYSAEQIAAVAAGDKKKQGSKINLIMPRRIGECIIRPTEISDLSQIIRIGLEEKPCE